MPRKLCCTACFDDRQLEHEIFPFLEAVPGTCDYCGSTGDLLPPSKLSNYFNSLISIYERSSSGTPLVERLRTDWKLFNTNSLNAAQAKELLSDVLDDGEIVRQAFCLSPEFEFNSLADWDSLKREMLHQNRWFMNVPFDAGRLEDILSHLLETNLEPTWHRARLMGSEEPFLIAQMKAPPKRLATHGRANPPGIPYLYLGSTPNTAVAEIRPHTGEHVRVADFELNGGLNLVDLRKPRKSVSPFVLDDPELIGQLLADIPFLERLGAELTRPVLPSSSAIDYIPSQYFCEFIKKCRFDGVIYRSSVSDGINIALFDPEHAQPFDISTYRVTDVSVDIALLNS